MYKTERKRELIERRESGTKARVIAEWKGA